MALTAILITFSTNSNLGEYKMVIISNVTIGGAIIPYRKADNTVKIRHYGFKGHKIVITSVISDNGQEIPYVVLTLSVFIYMLCTEITFLTCHKYILVI